MAQHVNVQYVQFNTQGSTARKVMPKISAHLRELPRIKKRAVRRIYVDPVAILGTMVAVCMLVMMVVGVNQLRTEQQETARLEQYVEALQMENRQLQAEYEASCDLEAIEKTALALGMIPQQDAKHTVIEIETPQEQTPISLWNRIGTFLTGLFA